MTIENTQNPHMIIIGAGIAGLSTGIYAQMNGYKSRIYEMHTQPGGLMTAWKRKGYTIDGCIHWLTGSSKDRYPQYYRWWEEIGLIQGRDIFDPDVFVRIEGADGKVLNLYANIDRLEQHLLELAPEDASLIKQMCQSIRVFTNTHMAPPKNIFERIWNPIRMVPVMPHMMKWGKLNMKDFAGKFTNPFLHRCFSNLWFPEMTAMGLFFTLAMLHNRGAGYTLGGSLPMAYAVEKRYTDLGGEIHYNTRVKRILVENDRAVGVELEDGSVERADVVVSAADGYTTLFHMLEERYITDDFRKQYDGSQLIFPPVLYIGLGINRTFDDLPACTGGIAMELDEPVIAAGEAVKRLDAMIYNFDPALAPAGKTAMNVMLPTSYTYWKELYGDGSNREEYDAEKQKVALQVIQRLGQRFPGLEDQVEMADVATPVTFERYTGNWQGSFEGWIPTPQNVMKPLPKTLPGLNEFYMVGQWVQPGGGLPSGVMTGQEVIKQMCKKDGKKFVTTIE